MLAGQEAFIPYKPIKKAIKTARINQYTMFKELFFRLKSDNN
jgi:hypothetical protein